MLLGDFGGLFGVLGGTGNRRRNTRFLVDLGGPFVGAGNSDKEQEHKVSEGLGSHPTRGSSTLTTATHFYHSLVAPVNRGRRIYIYIYIHIYIYIYVYIYI